jgi:cytosine permease
MGMKTAPLRSPDPTYGTAARPETSGPLPEYIASAKPNPQANRAPWYKNTAPTYAGIFLWFAFWDPMSGNGLSAGGLGATLLGVVIGALICHFLFFIVPGNLGMQTGLPLYVVGASTFGAAGSLIMPGFLMGILQFGWLGVNIYFSSTALAGGFGASGLFVPLCIVWGVAAAFVGLKGIQYVAKVATYLPLIPLAVLLMGLAKFGPAAASYTPPAGGAGGLSAMLLMVTAVVGFFATAGAAGVDICSNNRDKKDVSMGGWVGIVIAIILTAGISVLAVAGARQMGVLSATDVKMTDALQKTFSSSVYGAIMIGLTIASFPGACFSSFIAANSFKTVMPKVNPFISVGIGTIVSIILAITGAAGQLPSVFGLIGASFGPIVGAMVVDYLLAGGRWAGPRAGVNVAGWIAWAVGFIVGILPNGMIPAAMRVDIPCAPVAAFIVGAVVYFICAKLGMTSPVIPYNKTATAKA